ncbi:MAG: AraC family transcriptional regulator [Faecalibacterium sp.]|nr:AraC family transcriptional regulator [Faecalibacterium sp.]
MSLSQLLEDILRDDPNCRKSSVDAGYAYLFEDNTAQQLDNADASWDIRDQIILTTWKTDRRGILSWRVDYSKGNICKRAQAPYTHLQVNSLHKHNYIEITYVLEGRIRQQIEGKEVEFHAGDLYIIDSRSMYREQLLVEDSKVIFIGISNNFFTETMLSSEHDTQAKQFLSSTIFEHKKKYDYLVFHPRGSDEKVQMLLSGIVQEMIGRQVGFSYLIKGYVARMLGLLTEDYTFSISAIEKRQLRQIVFQDVQNYLFSHYQDASIEQLVGHFNYNLDYFNRLIKEKTGKTYSAYLQEIRLAKAANLLKSSNLNISDIAEAVGYSNQGYFYKIFEKRYGVTPKKYRAED